MLLPEVLLVFPSLLFVSLCRVERHGSREGEEGVEYRFNASPVYTFDVERGQRAVKKQRLRTLLLPLLPPLLLLLLLVSDRLLASLVNPPCFLSAYTHRISPSCSFARRVNFCRGFSLSLSSPSSSVVFLAFFSLLDFPSVFFCFCKFVGSFLSLSLRFFFSHACFFSVENKADD